MLAGLEDGETPVNIFCLKPGESMAAQPDFLFVTVNGQIKRTPAAEYDVKRAKYAAITLKDGDRLLCVQPADPANTDVLILSHSGMSIRFHADTVPVQGRTAGGVKGMVLEDRDTVLWVNQPAATDAVLLVSERGYAKRVPFADFEAQARAGKGVKAFYFNRTGSNGTRVAGAKLVSSDDAPVKITQKMSPATEAAAGEVVFQPKTGKGIPFVMALMDDVVTGIE